MSNKLYALKESQTFETVFIGTMKECDEYLEKNELKGSYQYIPLEQLRGNGNNVDARQGNR
jgi:hypothetical protein